MADISKIDNGTEYNLKDATARAGIESPKTLKSSVVTVTDAAPINAEDITVDITPQQDLHGYDRPWAGGAGKNKLNYMNFNGVQGGTVTKSNETLTITGTNARTGANITDKPVNYLPAGTYTLSFKVTSITNYQNQPTFFGFVVKKSGGAHAYTSVSVNQTGTKFLTYTLSEGDRFERIDFNINDQSSALSNACTFEIKDIQVEEGAQATTFAPYSNICPIEGRTGAELDRVGKNKLPMTISILKSINTAGTWNGNTYIYNGVSCEVLTDGSNENVHGIKVTGAASKNIWFRITPNTTDVSADTVLSGCPASGSFETYCLRMLQSNDETPVGNDTGSGLSIPSAYNDVNLYIRIASGYTIPTGGLLFYPMIRLATETDPTYEPYQGQQYTASFGETIHGGKWHVTKGGTDKTMREVDLGDLTWSYTSGYGGLFYAPVPDAKYSGRRSLIGYDCYSSRYKSKGNTPWTQLSNGEINVGSDTAGAGKPYVNVKDNRYSDTTTFKSAVSGVQLVYELATPTTISTPKQNVPMLQGINTVSADCGDTQLKYQPDNVIGELKGEIQKANSFVERMALREGSGAKDFSYGGWSFRLYIYRSMGQISMSVERISASSVTEQAVVKVFNGESDYRAPEELRPMLNLLQAATYTTPSGWSIQVYLKDDGYIMFTGIAPEVGASAPTSSNWNLVEPWATHQQAKDLFNN